MRCLRARLRGDKPSSREIKYILDNNKYCEQYVKDYTNASFLIDEKFDFKDGPFPATIPHP